MVYFNLAKTRFHVNLSQFRQNNIAKMEYWSGSPFEVVSEGVFPAFKGKFGEDAIRDILDFSGYKVEKTRPKEKADLAVTFNDHRITVEVKTSFLAIDGSYLFQQIRPEEDYDLLLCFGVDRDNIVLYPFTKEEELKLINDKIIVKQHGKQTYWFTLKKEDRSDWHLDGTVDATLNFIEDYCTKKSLGWI